MTTEYAATTARVFMAAEIAMASVNCGTSNVTRAQAEKLLNDYFALVEQAIPWTENDPPGPQILIQTPLIAPSSDVLHIVAEELLVMQRKAAAALVALLASALMFSNRDASAYDCHVGGSGKAVSSSSPSAMRGWLDLHRPDGEVVHVKANQIIFVTSAAGTGAYTCAQSRLQLVNEFIGVRESVEEMMRVIQVDETSGQYGT
jgi:hypothetical protein